MDYALFATQTECKVYARTENQFGGEWIHILTDMNLYSSDTSYGATPVLWATTGSFTVNNLKIYQPRDMEQFDTIEDVVGFASVATKRFDLAQQFTDKTGFADIPSGATVNVESGTLIDAGITNGIFRYSNGAELWSSLETGKRFAYFKAKVFEDQALEIFVQNVDGLDRRGSFKISATEFKEHGFFNDTEYARPGGAGTDWVEYLLVSTSANNVKLYAKGTALSNDKWVLACAASGWAGTNEKSNGLYFSGKGYVKEVVLYGQAETYDSLDEINGEPLVNMPEHEINTETTTATGERFTGSVGPSIKEGMVSVFRAKLDDESSSMRVAIRKPGETSANTTSFEFTVAADGFTSNAALLYNNEGFKAGTDYVEYALFATKTECKVYARAENQFEGKWVHVLTDITASSTDSSYYASPVIWATTGTFTVNNLKIYQKEQPVETYDSIDQILGFVAGASKDYDLTTSNYGYAYGSAALESGVGVNMNNGGYWRFGGNGSSSLGAGKAIYFRAKAESGKNTYIYLHIPDSSKTEAVYAFMLNENGVGTSDHNSHKTYCYEASNSHVDFAPGTEFAEYLAVDNEDGTGLHIYARQDGLYDGKWIQTSRMVGYFPSLSATSEFYMTSNGSLSAVRVYEKNSYSDIDDILGFSAEISQEYDLTVENYGRASGGAVLEDGVGVTMNGGLWRVGGNSTSSLGVGKAVYFRAKAESGKNTYIYLHIPDSSKTEAAYAFMLNENGIGTTDHNTQKNYCHEAANSHVDFVPGTEFAEYLAVDNEDGSGLHIYARQDGLYNGEWIRTSRIIGNYPYLSATSEFYMTTNGTLGAVKMYEQPKSLSTIDEVVGSAVMPVQTFTDFMRYTPNATYSPLKDGVFVFRAKACEDGTAIHVYAHDPSTEKNAYAFKITKNGLEKVSSQQAVVLNKGFVPGTEICEYLVTENQATDGVVVYVKNAEEWEPIFKIIGHTTSTPYSDTFGLYIFKDENSKAQLNSATIYTTNNNIVSEDATKPESATNLYFEDDFSGNRNYKITGSGYMVEDGAVLVNLSGYYALEGVSIPIGGYAEFKLSGNHTTTMIIGDSTSKMEFSVGDDGNTYRIWRIVRNADGTYNGFWRAEDESAWHMVFENETPTAIEDGKTKIEIYQPGDGTAKLDELKVYVPDTFLAELMDGEELSLVDGVGNNTMDLTEELVSATYKTMTAMVRQGSAKKMLLIAEYSDQGILSKLTTKEVPAGDKVSSIMHDVTENDVVVFLWDGVEGIRCLKDEVRITYAK